MKTSERIAAAVTIAAIATIACIAFSWASRASAQTAGDYLCEEGQVVDDGRRYCVLVVHHKSGKIERRLIREGTVISYPGHGRPIMSTGWTRLDDAPLPPVDPYTIGLAPWSA